MIDRGDERGYRRKHLSWVEWSEYLPGMQAAFVDIGLERAAFLYVGDIYPDMLHMHEGDLDGEGSAGRPE